MVQRSSILLPERRCTFGRKVAWQRQLAQIADWSAWLAEGDDIEKISILRRNADKGLPCGSSRFIKKLEKLVGGALQYCPQGRSKKGAGGHKRYRPLFV